MGRIQIYLFPVYFCFLQYYYWASERNLSGYFISTAVGGNTGDERLVNVQSTQKETGKYTIKRGDLETEEKCFTC